MSQSDVDILVRLAMFFILPIVLAFIGLPVILVFLITMAYLCCIAGGYR